MSAPPMHPPPPGYPVPAPRPPTGTASWALGFLAYVPIPFLGQIAAGVVMAALYPAQRRKSPVAAANGRRAANWGLTYVLLTVLAVGLTVPLGMYSNTLPTVEDRQAFLPVALLPLGVWAFGVNVLHVVLVIIGTVQAARGRVFRNVVQIPFLRRRPEEG